MAVNDTTTVAPGVTLEDFVYGYWMKGTKQALLASGLAKEEWFWNGRRSANGRRLRTVHFRIDGKRATCRPQSWTDGEYMIEVHYSAEESNRRHKVLQQEQEVAAAREAEKLALAALPTNLENYRADTVNIVASAIRAIRMVTMAPSGGYGFSPEVMTEINDAAITILQAVKTSNIRFRAVDRAAQVAKIKHEMVKIDSKFSAFMTKAVCNASTKEAM
jgi:hypothetical protein